MQRSSTHRIFLGAITCVLFLNSNAFAQLIVNSPLPIEYRVTINPIVASNSDGSNTTGFLGTATEEAEVKSLIDTIFAQAGIDVEWQGVDFWNDDFANIGTPGANDPRPSSDASDIFAQANLDGIADPNPLVINLIFVENLPVIGNVGENQTATISFVDENGVLQSIGDNFPNTLDGREEIASVFSRALGHNLGLLDIVESENLMQFRNQPDQGQRLNADQVTTIRQSRFAIAIPEPASMSLLVVVSLILAGRRRR